MKFDDVLEHIGGFGKFQKFVFGLACFPVLLAGLFMLNPVFLLGIPEHRCAIPGYENDTYEIQNDEHQALVDMFIPTSDEFEYNRCHLCESSSQWNSTIAENCTISRAVKCNRWVYDKTVFLSTFVTGADLVCDKSIWTANAGMILYGGMLFGSLASGMVADMFGRKPVLYIACLTMVASSFGFAWAKVYWLFCVLEFFLGGSIIASFMSAYVISVELTSIKKRLWPGVVSNLPYAAGLLVLSAVAYWLRDWFWIQLTTSIPGVLLIAYWWLIPESPRWLLTKGRVQEAEAIIRKAARWNNTTVPDNFAELVTVEDEEDMKFFSAFVKLFTTRKQLVRTMVIFFDWTASSLAYFGLALNSYNLNGNLYLNFGLSGLVEIPAYFLAIFLVDRVGRRLLFCSTMIIGGLACGSTIFAITYGSSGSSAVTIVLSLMGRLCVTAAFAVEYIHHLELFPTVVRNAGLCSASLFGRIGAMVAPYIVLVGESYSGPMKEALPLLIFGGVSLLSGVISLVLPETLNKHLPDTVQEGIDLQSKTSVFRNTSLGRE